MSRSGFTFLEMLIVITLGVIMIAASVPAFVDTMRRVQHGAAVRKVLTDLRQARSNAIATGWEYRVIGYDKDETGARKNNYRILARLAPAAWPAENSAVFEDADRLATAWVDLSEVHPGITFDTTSSRFEVTFDSRGAAAGAAAGFNPLRLVGPHGDEASLTVSVVGGIGIQ